MTLPRSAPVSLLAMPRLLFKSLLHCWRKGSLVAKIAEYLLRSASLGWNTLGALSTLPAMA